MSSNNAASNSNDGSGGESLTNLNSNSCNGQSTGGHRQDLVSYFRGLTRLGSVRSSSYSSEACEQGEEPTELNTINSSGGFLVVSTDKLSIKYTNVNLHGHDVGVIQGNRPALAKRLVYYFEIFVKDAGAKGQISLGFTSENFKMLRQPSYVLKGEVGDSESVERLMRRSYIARILRFYGGRSGKPTAAAIMVTTGFFIVDKERGKHLGRHIQQAMLVVLVSAMDCVALLAYEQPRESFVGFMLEESQRKVGADVVNAMILLTNPNLKDTWGCFHSFLEGLLRHLTAFRLKRRSLNRDQGEAFHLDRVLSSSMKAAC